MMFQRNYERYVHTWHMRKIIKQHVLCLMVCIYRNIRIHPPRANGICKHGHCMFPEWTPFSCTMKHQLLVALTHIKGT